MTGLLLGGLVGSQIGDGKGRKRRENALGLCAVRVAGSHARERLSGPETLPHSHFSTSGGRAASDAHRADGRRHRGEHFGGRSGKAVAGNRDPALAGSAGNGAGALALGAAVPA